MDLKNSHGGYAGKSLAEKMRDRTDELYKEWMENEKLSAEQADQLQYKIEGACEMMAILTSTTEDLQWNSMEARYEDRKRNATG